jgi:hypothetical protein
MPTPSTAPAAVLFSEIERRRHGALVSAFPVSVSRTL